MKFDNKMEPVTVQCTILLWHSNWKTAPARSKKQVKITQNLKKVCLILDVFFNLTLKSDSTRKNKWKWHLTRVSGSFRTAANSKRDVWFTVTEKVTKGIAWNLIPRWSLWSCIGVYFCGTLACKTRSAAWKNLSKWHKISKRCALY